MIFRRSTLEKIIAETVGDNISKMFDQIYSEIKVHFLKQKQRMDKLEAEAKVLALIVKACEDE